MLVSSANNIGIDLSFIALGKINGKTMGPKLIPAELHVLFLPMKKGNFN